MTGRDRGERGLKIIVIAISNFAMTSFENDIPYKLLSTPSRKTTVVPIMLNRQFLVLPMQNFSGNMDSDAGCIFRVLELL